ncbi:hypothetical protein [Paenibacillus sp. MMO-177]|uniref:hypothetical protein n=1 Tax=Paenibacillus sp. MMO-177 TaxID=3081289 RepID=UPI003018A448
MTFTLIDWIKYTFWGVFGFMIIDFVIAFSKSFWQGSFKTSFLPYLKDILFYVYPLYFLLSIVNLDPTEWTLITLFFIGGLSLIVKYVLDIIGRFKPKAEDESES